MPDLYLQALLQGEIVEKGIRSTARKLKKNRFEIEIEKRIDEYLKNLDQDDSMPNQYMTPAMKMAKLKEEMRAEATFPELSKHIKEAFKILNCDARAYISEEQLTSLLDDFESAIERLDNLDVSNSFTDNFKNLLQLSDSTLELIIAIAVGKFKDGKASESLSLYVLLSTFTPEYSEYWYRAGICSHSNGKFEEALKFYHTAISLDPQHIEARVLSIDCLLNLSKIEDAKNAYHEVNLLSDSISIEDEWKQMLQEQKLALNI